MKKHRIILICLALSVLFNLILLSFGLIYLQYTGLSFSYAISRIPYALSCAKSTKADTQHNILKEVITEAYPQLETDISEYEEVCILREWAASVIDCSDYPLLLSVRYSDLGSWSAYDIYRAFQNDLGGAWCADSALFLIKVYQLFGFEAYYASWGTTLSVTHAVTLVSINHEGRQILSIQDAYFNFTYEDVNGEPMDYFDMLRLLKEKRDDEIEVIKPEITLTRDTFFYGMNGLMEIFNCSDVELLKRAENEGDNIYKTLVYLRRRL